MLRAVESWHAAQERRVSFSNEFTATAQMKKKNLFFFPTKKSKVETITTIYSETLPTP